MSLDTRMQSLWYGNSRVAWLLLPLSGLFAGAMALRRWLYRAGVLKVIRVDRPVVVIGNISVGGTGKTPLVIWLARQLSAQGLKVAVIARGYRGKARQWPQVVNAGSDPELVGDEPVLIAQQTGVAVVAGPDRVADAQRAIELGADIIISDDGLQHYRLFRDCEIVVMDGDRKFGNGFLLPAGPLRELPARLQRADLLLVNQRGASMHASVLKEALQYRVTADGMRALTGSECRSLETLRGQQVHIVTGIGNPRSFISALQATGIKVLPRILPDHARFTPQDLQFGDALPVLMTAKDAVKCRQFDAGGNCWVVEAVVKMDDATAAIILNCIRAKLHH